MCKSLKDINEGSIYLNNWGYQQTSDLLRKGKLVALLGGDHSTRWDTSKQLPKNIPSSAFYK
jgi:agmatinase